MKLTRILCSCELKDFTYPLSSLQVAFWLLENGLRVLIAACDTFRSGAVEQLRTHTRHLAALHPSEREGGPVRVMLYERGYGKDAAGIAMEAIHYGELYLELRLLIWSCSS